MKKWMLGRIVFLFATASAVAAETLPVTFRLHAPDAKIVAVAGEFNDWDATSLPMRKSTNGDWSASIRVPAGDYGYKFVVDGQWTFDPAQPLRKFVDQLENSRLVVGESVANEAAAASAPSPARRKPSADWDATGYKQAVALYNSTAAAFQQYLTTRSNPDGLKTLEKNLHGCVASLEAGKDGAPDGDEVQGMIDRCNKLLFDIHGTMQISP